MLLCDPSSFTPIKGSNMHRTNSDRSRARCLKKKRRFMSSIKGVSHLSRRTKRRLYCKLQLWMWRRRKDKCNFGIYRTRKHACASSPSSGSGLSVTTQSQKNKIKAPAFHTPHLNNSDVGTSTLVSSNGESEESLRRQNSLLSQSESISPTEKSTFSCSSQNLLKDTNVALGNVVENVPPQKEDTLVQLIEMGDPVEECHTVKPLLTSDRSTCTNVKESRTVLSAQRPEIDSPSGQLTPLTPCQDQTTNNKADENTTSRKTLSSQDDVCLKVLTEDIHGFLDDFYSTYGSFIPLQKTDVLRHVKRRCNVDFNGRKDFISSEVARYRYALVQEPAPFFRVVYKKHSLTLDDLSTLADQNWLNDQVMNMYGELIMESGHHKVHFLNSFFHRQLMMKGYDGVKRWTKQVDLFSKSLLLVPVHLEVHWCLVTADMVRKKICIYDSKGNALQKIARNILKYLMTEAKEKKQTDYENGWAVSFDEKVPQQTNENDCGVFVLEYSRCLALAKPLQFSQKDIPKIRKRIYKELCECKLHEQG
ncbi:sentrin-specific protease 5-like [Notolabrus celidotus]|uniref:sentrin-specific protease 5-like n=1 Tax=Notolabrus celidotus TaxID=1203425 RepID=UPI00148F53C7|nr:sentrin-specific protease 5-like [Notolabrus celidotus]XP_034558550.1 sentrin-specific protease 5-like [Notolabrus celidotus]